MKKKLALIFLFVIALFFPNCVLAQTATITTVNPNPTTAAVAPTKLNVPSTSNTTIAVATINSTVPLIATNSPDYSTSATSTSTLPTSIGSTLNSSAPTTQSSLVKEEGKGEKAAPTHRLAPPGVLEAGGRKGELREEDC